MRRALAPSLDRVADPPDRAWVTPDRLTSVGLVLGLASALAAGARSWSIALILWLLSRMATGGRC